MITIRSHTPLLTPTVSPNLSKLRHNAHSQPDSQSKSSLECGTKCFSTEEGIDILVKHASPLSPLAIKSAALAVHLIINLWVYDLAIYIAFCLSKNTWIAPPLIEVPPHIISGATLLFRH